MNNMPSVIREMPIETVNRIAAGEVVERPASVIKELVENAIDAGASQIDIVYDGGGLGLVSVTDNGSGMSKNCLSVAIKRHATSKLLPDSEGNWRTVRPVSTTDPDSLLRIQTQIRIRPIESSI